jgi:hypothetical protein
MRRSGHPDAVYLETCARSAPYVLLDFYQTRAPKPYDDPQEARSCLPEELYSKSPVVDIVGRLKEAGVQHVKVGRDSGLQECGFLLYNSVRPVLRSDHDSCSDSS